jgi:uncharacterized membrane protein
VVAASFAGGVVGTGAGDFGGAFGLVVVVVVVVVVKESTNSAQFGGSIHLQRSKQASYNRLQWTLRKLDSVFGPCRGNGVGKQ